jgi:hypothetical protein
MNYCDNRSLSSFTVVPENLGCKNAEVAIWDESGEWKTKEMLQKAFAQNDHSDDVIGYITMDTWPKIVAWCENYKCEIENKNTKLLK